MLYRLKALVQSIRERFARPAVRLGDVTAATATAARDGAGLALSGLTRARGTLIALGILGAAGYALYSHPPMQTVGRSEVGVRVNRLTGGVSEWRDGSVLVVPGLHELRVYSMRDQIYRPQQLQRADGASPVQSVEGLSFGVDLAVRYALDPAKVGALSKNLPDDIAGEIVDPAVQGVIYKVFARYTVREIFSTKRPEIQQAIESELKPKLAADGLALRDVQIGKVDLPADYRRGMDRLLAEELAAEKMRYTLELKDKRVKEMELDGEAEKVRREKAAEAAAREQIIAAKGQEEAMKHVLPFKQRQIEQRQLEAEADKQSRIRIAEGSAQARRVEANGEADARQKLADAEAYRLDRVGKANAEQMEREGALVTRHPLLIQKALADKLSDKVQVIIAPAPADGGFIGSNLLGTPKRTASLGAGEPAAKEGK
jgi:regulator of protease activity HflC (stomatin/prohibitin superfamily)